MCQLLVMHPGATYVDAFLIRWDNQFFYAFPPFSLIACCLQKIAMERTEGITIVPLWPTQPWYSQLLHLIVDVPRTLSQLTMLKMPGREHEPHPRIKTMVLMARRLSGNPLQHNWFLRRLKTSSSNLGGKELNNNTHLTLRGGFRSVIDNKLIVFPPIYPKRYIFLVELYESGIWYSGINTARSSFSCVVQPINGISFGFHPTVTRFLKRVFKSRPTAPRYTQTWDIGKVISYLQTILNSDDVTLKDLTLKTVMLVSLVSAQRGKTIHYLNLNDMISSETLITYTLSKLLKQSKPGVRPMVVQFTSYPADPRSCVVTTLKMYLARLRCKRGDYKQLFITYLKPFKQLSRSTISRWIKVVLCSSGINVEVLRQHSTRAAATSKASASLIPLDQILSTAGWSSVSTFAKFYNKQIDVKNSFAESVLQSED